MKLYSARELAINIGVTPNTLAHWQAKRLIPSPTLRVGLNKKRMYNTETARAILDFAKSIGHYPATLLPW